MTAVGLAGLALPLVMREVSRTQLTPANPVSIFGKPSRAADVLLQQRRRGRQHW